MIGAFGHAPSGRRRRHARGGRDRDRGALRHGGYRGRRARGGRGRHLGRVAAAARRREQRSAPPGARDRRRHRVRLPRDGRRPAARRAPSPACSACRRVCSCSPRSRCSSRSSPRTCAHRRARRRRRARSPRLGVGRRVARRCGTRAATTVSGRRESPPALRSPPESRRRRGARGDARSVARVRRRASGLGCRRPRSAPAARARRSRPDRAARRRSSARRRRGAGDDAPRARRAGGAGSCRLARRPRGSLCSCQPRGSTSPAAWRAQRSPSVRDASSSRSTSQASRCVGWKRRVAAAGAPQPGRAQSRRWFGAVAPGPVRAGDHARGFTSSTVLAVDRAESHCVRLARPRHQRLVCPGAVRVWRTRPPHERPIARLSTQTAPAFWKARASIGLCASSVASSCSAARARAPRRSSRCQPWGGVSTRTCRSHSSPARARAVGGSVEPDGEVARVEGEGRRCRRVASRSRTMTSHTRDGTCAFDTVSCQADVMRRGPRSRR